MAKTPLNKAVERNAKYWDERAIKRLTDAEKQSEAYIARINKMYDQAQRNIQRDIENIYENYSKATGMDVQSLKTLLSKSETDKLWEELKAQGLDEYVKANYKARISRLEKLQAQVYAKAKELYPKEQQAHTACYEGVVNGSYYKTIYDVQMGTGLDFAFSKIDDNMMTALLNERWSGKNYSQRIWGNTDLLAESLSEILGGALMSGQSIAKTSRQIRERFNVAKYYADRLVRTETNRFNNEADAMAYEEMEMDQYVFMATLDTRTSTICQEMDGKVIPLKERRVGENYPPMHPNCRSKTRAYMGEEIEKTLKRRARNPVTGKNEIVGNISYKEWAEKNGLTNSGKSGKIQSGGKYEAGSLDWVNSRTEKATAEYEKIRKANDIKAISKSSGMTEREIQTIKNHIFFDSHIKYDGKIERFDVDYDMAVAWKRLTNGTPEKRDILLLKHELLESQLEKKYKLVASEAHAKANGSYPWDKVLLKELGEMGEADDLL